MQGIAPGGARLSALRRSRPARSRRMAARAPFPVAKAFARKVGAKGWIGMTWPKQYGGHERSHLERYVVTEEMLAHRAPTRAYSTADRQSGPVILRYGQEEIKADDPAAHRLGRIVLLHRPSASPIPAPTCSPPRPARPRPMAAGWSTAARSGPANAHNSDYMIALLRTSPPTKENRRHGLTQFLIAMQIAGDHDPPDHQPDRRSTISTKSSSTTCSCPTCT